MIMIIIFPKKEQKSMQQLQIEESNIINSNEPQISNQAKKFIQKRQDFAGIKRGEKERC